MPRAQHRQYALVEPCTSTRLDVSRADMQEGKLGAIALFVVGGCLWPTEGNHAGLHENAHQGETDVAMHIGKCMSCSWARISHLA